MNGLCFYLELCQSSGLVSTGFTRRRSYTATPFRPSFMPCSFWALARSQILADRCAVLLVPLCRAVAGALGHNSLVQPTLYAFVGRAAMCIPSYHQCSWVFTSSFVVRGLPSSISADNSHSLTSPSGTIILSVLPSLLAGTLRLSPN